MSLVGVQICCSSRKTEHGITVVFLSLNEFRETWEDDKISASDAIKPVLVNHLENLIIELDEHFSPSTKLRIRSTLRWMASVEMSVDCRRSSSNYITMSSIYNCKPKCY